MLLEVIQSLGSMGIVYHIDDLILSNLAHIEFLTVTLKYRKELSEILSSKPLVAYTSVFTFAYFGIVSIYKHKKDKFLNESIISVTCRHIVNTSIACMIVLYSDIL
jgi:hypothetical protein